jgi:hypothetical protein
MMRVSADDPAEPVPAPSARPEPAPRESSSVPEKQWPAKAKVAEEVSTPVRSESRTDEVKAARAPSVTFAAGQGSQTDRMKWNEVQNESGKRNFVARFVTWLAKKTFPKSSSAPAEGLTANSGTKPAKVIQFESGAPGVKKQSPAWQAPSEGNQLAPLVFPRLSRAKSTEKSRKEPQVAVAFKETPVQWTEQRGNQARLRQSFPAAESIPVLPDSSARALSREIQDPAPHPQFTYWPELSPNSERSPVPFAEENAAQPRERTRASGTEPNWWPELAPEAARQEYGWRSLMRSMQRSQRLEKEQRGY